MRPHDLRHTHVALLIAAGEDPYVISERLGHVPIRTTYDVYGRLARCAYPSTSGRTEVESW